MRLVKTCITTHFLKMDRCDGSCNNLIILMVFHKCNVINVICVPYKTEDINLHVFNMTTRLNKSKAKHVM